MSIKFQQCTFRQYRLYHTDRQAGREEGREEGGQTHKAELFLQATGK